MTTIRRQAPGDGPAVEALLDAAFGVERFDKTAQRLRDGRQPADGLTFVALAGGRLVGTIALWDVEAGPGRPALLLGPVAVAAARRGRGLGARLVRRALNQATARGDGAVILVGDAPYYGRFGFTRRLTLGLDLPGPVEAARFLGLELRPGSLAGARGPVLPAGQRLALPARGAAGAALPAGLGALPAGLGALRA